MKYLIINADDFGYSPVFNREILKLAQKRLISSTTVMMNWVKDDQASQIKQLIALAKANNISIGLHLEFSDSNFRPEIEKQYQKFLTIFKFQPSHIDLHKKTYQKTGYPIIADFCQQKNLPCRNKLPDSTNTTKTDNQAISGTDTNLQELKTYIKNIKNNQSYEILFHPGVYDPDCRSSLNRKRAEDIEKIKKIYPLLKKYNIKLISYSDLALI